MNQTIIHHSFRVLLLCCWLANLYACAMLSSSDDHLRGTRFKNGGAYKGSSPSISADGNKIVFGSTRYGIGDICIIDFNGDNWKQLTDTDAYEGEPSFSNDGKKIVFVSERDGNGEIYLMNVDGSEQKRLTFYDLYDANPSFSPDGKKIVFTRQLIDQQSGVPQTHIFTMNCNGSNIQKITNGDGWEGDPSFSPSGEKIIYKSGWHGSYDSIDIRTIDLNGNNETVIIKQGLCHEPSFSPDGKNIIFIADFNNDGEWRLYRKYLNSGLLEKIRIPNGVYVEDPSYFDDGEKILFLSMKNERGGSICFMDRNGKNINEISNTY